MYLSIGLMSGTSMDGIDAALLATDGSSHISGLDHDSFQYAPQFRTLLKAAEYAIRKRGEQAIAAGKTNSAYILEQAEEHFLEDMAAYLQEGLRLETGEISKKVEELSRYFEPSQPPTIKAIIDHSTHLHGDLVQRLMRKAGKSAEEIQVVGCHGQAFFHRPAQRISIVLSDGQTLADQLGITVVNDFRRQDVEAGGQGAPFAPLYHQALAVRDNKIPCAVVNCGGIANVTFITSDDALDLVAFDTGPGNGLVDRFVQQRTNGAKLMDTDGNYGRQGQIHESMLKLMYAKSIIREGKNFFDERPPKSLDIGDMKLIPELNELSLEEGCATLEAFTADTIVQSLRYVTGSVCNWILAGGGWHNPVILEQLKIRLKQYVGKDITIQRADEIGWNSQSLEAQIFAYLAVRCLQNKPLSVPGTTGAPYPISGGTIFKQKKSLPRER